MKSVVFHLLRLHRQDTDFALPVEGQFRHSANDQESQPEPRIDILCKSLNYIDFRITWVEQRRISGIFKDAKVTDFILDMFRMASVRLREDDTLISTGLRRQYSRALKLIWPEEKTRPAYSEVRFNLVKAISNPDTQKYLNATIDDVIIDDLPVDRIPSVTLRARRCSLDELHSLVSGTSARIREITFVPKHDDIAALSLAAHGVVRVSTEVTDWQLTLDAMEDLLRDLGLVEGEGHARGTESRRQG